MVLILSHKKAVLISKKKKAVLKKNTSTKSSTGSCFSNHRAYYQPLARFLGLPTTRPNPPVLDVMSPSPSKPCDLYIHTKLCHKGKVRSKKWCEVEQRDMG